MTRREREIVKILRENPLISQNELAERLGISRSSAAVHITNLMKKGVIIGKGYVIKDEKYAAVLGGANIDINGFPTGRYIASDSNPGIVKRTVGGVGRNVAELMTKLGVETRLLTLVGNDEQGSYIIEKTKMAGVDVNLIKRSQSHSTGVYLTIQDDQGDMVSAINQMDIYDKMDSTYISEVINIIKSAEVAFIDTNISDESVDYLFSKIDGTKIICDPVSVQKSNRIRNHLDKIYLLKPNKHEAANLSGIPITDDIETVKANGKYFMEQGVENLLLSLGEKGVYFKNKDIEGTVTHKKVKVINANGAGDALIATVSKELIESDDFKECIIRGVGAALLAVQTEETTPVEFNEEKIDQIIKEYDVKWKNI